MVKILQIDWQREAQEKKLDENNLLRQIANPVKKAEFSTLELKKIIVDMQKAMSKEIDGVAIAAPQIGIPKRIFIIKEEAYTIYQNKEKVSKWKPLIFINPKITKTSKKMVEVDEGCLSVRPLYGTTLRHSNVTLEAQDIDGHKFTYGASDLIAHIFQHETDHLEGVLFIDQAKNIQALDLTEIKEALKKEKKQIKNYEKL